MSKFTPGPWEIDEHYTESGWPYTVIIGGDRTTKYSYTVVIGSESEGDTPTDADLALISAAPDLYSALVMVRDADDDCKEDGLPTIPPMARAMIDAALAKADGNP